MIQMMKPPVPYYGGKSIYVDILLNYVPSHRCYVEVFGGAGALLFAKPPSKIEVYNDIDDYIVTMYRVIRNDYKRFVEYLDFLPYSRTEHNKFLQQLRENNFVDDVEKAVCVFYLLSTSFGGLMGSSFGTSKTKREAYTYRNRIKKLSKINERLRYVCIENTDFRTIFDVYDSDETFFYCDPPYVHETRKHITSYNHEMSNEDHIEMCHKMVKLKGMVLLSGYPNAIYDSILVKENKWHIDKFETHLNLTPCLKSKPDNPRTECLFYNEQLVQNLHLLNF